MKKNIVFMGTPSYAVRILEELLNDNFNILAIFTQADKAVGRKQILTPSKVKEFAINNNLEDKVHTPKSLKGEEISNFISSLKPDYIVVAAYGKILPKSILDIVPCINLHASLLPKYRGASPIQSAILNQEKESGVCTMLMDVGLDTGDVLECVKANIENKNSKEVFELFSNLAANLCVKTLNNFEQIQAQKQDESKASHCVKLKKEDGLLNLDDARSVYAKYLAFYEWPEVFLENNIKLKEIKLVDTSSKNKEKGVISKINKNSFILTCLIGSIEVFRLQAAGKKELDAKSFLNGARLKQGDKLV